MTSSIQELNDDEWERIQDAAETVRDGTATRVEIPLTNGQARIYAVPTMGHVTRIDIKEGTSNEHD